MSQLTITLSDKADALIAQLQREIFNRRRKEVSAAGVIETLVESGAKSQSAKRFATSWSNLVADIEQAARVAHAHGAKPARTTQKASISPAKELVKTRATKPKVTKPKAAQSKASASQASATVAKATPQSTGGSPSSRAPRHTDPTSVPTPASEGGAIPATAPAPPPPETAARPLPPRPRRPEPTRRAFRLPAAWRRPSAVLEPQPSPAPVEEPPLVALA